MRFQSARLPFEAARRASLSGFERSYVLQLLARHDLDFDAAAREAQLPVERLHSLVRKHVRPYFIERVRAFYGEKLDGHEVGRVADHLLALELKQTSPG